MMFETFDSNSRHSELTYGEWTVEWWKWALSIPSSKNPVVDTTGNLASEYQPDEVWFLAGILAEEGETKNFPHRKCNIPEGRPILIPVLNCEADLQYYPELKTDQELLNHVEKQVESVDKKELFVDGTLIPPARVHSDPPVFDLYVHSDFDRFLNGGHTRAAADGYWVFFRSLPRGKHTIEFSGSCEYGRLKSGASYVISII